MGQEIPPAPPEAEVIRLARKATGMTAEDAAAASKAHDPSGRGVGSTYWLDVERGRGGRRGEQVPIRASDRALAAMARAVGVEPRQLTEAGREDAARVLEEVLRRERRPLPPPLPVAVNSARAAGIDPDDLNDPWMRSVRDQVEAARRMHGDNPTGSQIFYGTPASSYEAGVWDDRSLGEESRIISIAIIRAYRARDAAGSQNHGRSGRAGLALVTLALR